LGVRPEYLRKYNPQQKLSFMWSPIGTANVAKYYPSPHYVDYVGCSVWKLENRSFAKTFAPVYQTLAQYGKPIIIAEFGVQAKQDQAAWIAGPQSFRQPIPATKVRHIFQRR
jgi:beta-mannanase